jgi:hypothetical protein
MKGKKTRFISARYSSYKYPELESDPEFARRLGMEVKTSLFFSEIVEDFDLHISPNAIRGRIDIIEWRIFKYLPSYTPDSYFHMREKNNFAYGLNGGNAYQLKPELYKLLSTLDTQLRWIKFCPAPKSFKDRWISELNEALKQIVDLAKQYRGDTLYIP